MRPSWYPSLESQTPWRCAHFFRAISYNSLDVRALLGFVSRLRPRFLLEPLSYPSALAHLLIEQIAMKELKEKKIPFTIRRYLPDGR